MSHCPSCRGFLSGAATGLLSAELATAAAMDAGGYGIYVDFGTADPACGNILVENCSVNDPSCYGYLFKNVSALVTINVNCGFSGGKRSSRAPMNGTPSLFCLELGTAKPGSGCMICMPRRCTRLPAPRRRAPALPSVSSSMQRPIRRRPTSSTRTACVKGRAVRC